MKNSSRGAETSAALARADASPGGTAQPGGEHALHRQDVVQGRQGGAGFRLDDQAADFTIGTSRV
ncbi:hypothetical protein [Castellaniella sp.]|uniref:hypothetical protein n=1 Tax=Castellaniella sp. TaxID=1955812 RepID=UPI002AFEBEE7|nr:hypothetical protein [Castellaniella sp.]